MTPHRRRSNDILRVDLHSHTIVSPDATTTPAQLVARARLAGLHRIAVTDHDVIDGALEAQAIDPRRVIVGEEIRCRCRTELIGLFLTEPIPSGLHIEETAERIRDQGGVVYAPHPYAYAWRPHSRARRALAVADIIEGFNARAFVPAWNRAAFAAAARQGLPVGAGSDSHFPWEVGRAYTEMPHFSCAGSFLQAVEAARPVGSGLTTALVHLASAGLKTARQLGLRPAPEPVPSRRRRRPAAAVGS